MYNQGHSTWVTLLWYLPFSLPVLFCNGFSVELSKFKANIERDREKEVEHNMWTLFLQLTQVLMSRIVDFILFFWGGVEGGGMPQDTKILKGS